MINQKLTRPARARNELLMARRLSARNYNAINKKSRNVSREAPPPLARMPLAFDGSPYLL